MTLEKKEERTYQAERGRLRKKIFGKRGERPCSKEGSPLIRQN